jgi:hypothetical protein
MRLFFINKNGGGGGGGFKLEFFYGVFNKIKNHFVLKLI